MHERPGAPCALFIVKTAHATQTAANATEEAAAALNIDLAKNRLTTDASEFVDDAKQVRICCIIFNSQTHYCCLD